MKGEGRSEVLDEMVSSGHLQPEDAELLRRGLSEAESRGIRHQLRALRKLHCSR